MQPPWSKLSRKVADTLYEAAVNNAISRPQADPKQLRADANARAAKLVSDAGSTIDQVVSELVSSSVEQGTHPDQLRSAITSSIVFSADNALMLARQAIGARPVRSARPVAKTATTAQPIREYIY
jgi:hypothetical protein